MVVQKTLNTLKSGSKDQKEVVAMSTAVFVVLIIFIIWGYFFLKNFQNDNAASAFPQGVSETTSSGLQIDASPIKSGNQTPNSSDGVPVQFDSGSGGGVQSSTQ